jgi:hypothetical protein
VLGSAAVVVEVVVVGFAGHRVPGPGLAPA